MQKQIENNLQKKVKKQKQKKMVSLRQLII